MNKKGKLKLRIFVLSAVSVAGLLAAGISFAQYDYYDPYSNSNIDYFPSNPVYTSPSPTPSPTPPSSTSGGTSGSTVPPSTTITAPAICANKPIANPQNTRSVEVRDRRGKVFYLSPPKEELTGVKAYPETSKTIYQIIYGVSGMQVDEKAIGLITVDNNCYPKFGYVNNLTSLTPPATPPVVPSSSLIVPENATAVKLDPATGEVFHAVTGELIVDARYDSAARKIYYKNTDSFFGTVLTDTTGYVNINPVIIKLKPASPPTGDTNYGSYPDVIRKKILPSPPITTEIPEDDSDTKKLSEPIINDINVDSDALVKFSVRVSAAEILKKVAVSGWDPKKKEEIVGHPETVKTKEDLEAYMEAVVITNPVIFDITSDESTMSVSVKEKARLFWFIPVKIKHSIAVNIQTGEPAFKRPWWAFATRSSFKTNYDEIKAELKNTLDSMNGTGEMSGPRLQMMMERQPQVMQKDVAKISVMVK